MYIFDLTVLLFGPSLTSTNPRHIGSIDPATDVMSVAKGNYNLQSFVISHRYFEFNMIYLCFVMWRTLPSVDRVGGILVYLYLLGVSVLALVRGFPSRAYRAGGGRPS